MKPCIASITGTRPQFIKNFALSRALGDRGALREIIINTGQHYDRMLSDVFFDELKLPKPDYELGIGSAPHGAQTARMIAGLEKILIDLKPRAAIVFGDTNTTLAGALAAAKLGIPVAHVEAGMRCGDFQMPEEINRRVTDRVSSLFFCPTETAMRNLAREGITENVCLTGDVMVDSFNTLQPAAARRSDILTREKLEPKNYALLTVHRAENTDDPKRLEAILGGFSCAPLTVIFPVHPRTKKVIESGVRAPANVRRIDPVSYMDMLALESAALIIATDSGGVQKEAYLAGVPCITLRETTEWPETVEYGWNQLVGANPDDIADALISFRPSVERKPAFGPPDASARIALLLENYCSN